MADTRDFLLEEIKHILKDVTNFLTITLKKEKLKKEVGARRDELTQEINSIITRVDKILPKDDQEEYADVELEGSHEAALPEEEDGELYEDTAVMPESPNKNVMSQGSKQDNQRGEDAELPEDETGEPYGDMKVGPIAATDLVKPIMEGFLEKRRKEGQIGLQQWQRRYCVIKENIFYYFKNRNDKQQKNVIILNGYEARPNPDYDKKHKKRDFLFELVCPAKRSFQFIASSSDEMNHWINAVTTASSVMPAPEPSSKKAAPDVVKEEIQEDNDEFYDDVDTYQKSKVGGSAGAEDTQTTDSTDFDPDMEIIDTDEVYEDVASQEPRAVRKPPPPHHHGSLPDVPPTSPHLHKSMMKPPAVPTSDRPKPEPPKPEPPGRHLDAKPIPVQRSSVESKTSGEDSVSSLHTTSKAEPWEDDYSNIYVGMWDSKADDENELGFKRGDFVHIISKEYDSYNWWVGEKSNKIGLVPKQYLMNAYVV